MVAPARWTPRAASGLPGRRSWPGWPRTTRGPFAAPDLDRRLWRYALAYTIRHIIFWPPDRAEADGLDPAHPLHTLGRLIDAPLPLAVT